MAWRYMVWFGMARRARHGTARSVRAQLGRQGKARFGRVRLALPRHTKEREMKIRNMTNFDWGPYPNFKPEEFACKCCGAVMVREGLVAALQELRGRYGKPITITSGYRCVHHNTAIGGAVKSRHMDGLAADIAAPRSDDRRALIKMADSFNGLGVGKTFLHLDLRLPPLPWQK